MSAIRLLEKRLDRCYRRRTALYRCLPDFLIIGAQKAGTTSLHHYLSQHPQLVPSYKKEVHYFDGGLNPDIDNYKQGKEWYCSHFPLQRCVLDDQKVFESSPLYLFNPLAAARIHQLIPKVKIIVLLRNPVERAISHYNFIKQVNLEDRNLYEALLLEEIRLKPVLIKKDYKNIRFIHQAYKSRGLYKQQLERYFMLFQRKKILLLSSEHFFLKPANSLRKVFDFLEVDTQFKIKDLKPRNITKSKCHVESEVYEYLENYFLPHNEALYQLVQNDYGW